MHSVHLAWHAADVVILEQLASEDPEMFEAFPCHLSHRNGMDKASHESVGNEAVKGVGPAANAETIERKKRFTGRLIFVSAQPNPWFMTFKRLTATTSKNARNLLRPDALRLVAHSHVQCDHQKAATVL
jgi:hypothetical protein